MFLKQVDDARELGGRLEDLLQELGLKDSSTSTGTNMMYDIPGSSTDVEAISDFLSQDSDPVQESNKLNISSIISITQLAENKQSVSKDSINGSFSKERKAVYEKKDTCESLSAAEVDTSDTKKTVWKIQTASQMAGTLDCQESLVGALATGQEHFPPLGTRSRTGGR